MKLKRFLAAALVAVFGLGIFSFSANAAGTYAISCKNDAYGMHLGSDYTDVAYVYNGVGVQLSNSANGAAEYLITEYDEAYVGNDCIYSGEANTNGTQVVAADVARMAINAIVGAVSNRVDQAYAANASGASATGLTFTTQNDGVSMSANGLVGGLGVWADVGNTSFENTQAFSSIRLDSMRFDGDASSYSVGVDKTFGKAMVGLVVSNLDADIKTTFNDGTYKQEVDTYGIYLAYRTSMLQIDLGMGQGDSDINTTRRDLGNDQTITGSTTADIEYSNARIAANFTRGKFTIMPSASYRTMDMDIAGFTDVRPSDILGNVAGDGLLFTSGNDTLTTTDDNVAARTVSSETMDIGVKATMNLGKIMPYLDLKYSSEDTSRATYVSEAGTDGNNAETAGTNYSSSLHIGGGIDFSLGSHITGGVRAGSINGRDDWDEDYFAGNVRLGF